MNKPILIYDNECFICRNFALFAQKAAKDELRIEGYGDYQIRTDRSRDLSPDLVHLDMGQGEILSGDAVYDKVLELYPNFHALNWIMDKLRIKPLVYTGAKKTASYFRKRCKSCK